MLKKIKITQSNRIFPLLLPSFSFFLFFYWQSEDFSEHFYSAKREIVLPFTILLSICGICAQSGVLWDVYKGDFDWNQT